MMRNGPVMQGKSTRHAMLGRCWSRSCYDSGMRRAHKGLGSSVLPSAAVIAAVCVSAVTSACAYFVTPRSHIRLDTKARESAIARAQLWTKTDIPAMDIKAGPQGPGSFTSNQTVVCDFVDETLEGSSPKFSCKQGDDKLKVKYGRTNGEAFAEVAASRLLWALGFGADHEYPVHVVCRGCPERLLPNSQGAAKGEIVFDIAAIERKMPGHEIEGPEGRGWAWFELGLLDPGVGGATRAERDALTLMAVILQHTDNKRDQQRLVCLDRHAKDEAPASCVHTFMLINDLGETFGRAGTLNLNATASVNLEAWARTPVWTPSDRCVGNLAQSWSGTLHDPPITEEGRSFLASLLTQLTDRQMRDLFEVARFPLRSYDKPDKEGRGDVDAWVRALKDKIDQVVQRSCAPKPTEPLR
jgi:hypothetical protein